MSLGTLMTTIVKSAFAIFSHPRRVFHEAQHKSVVIEAACVAWAADFYINFVASRSYE
jgi:hypothetical protein